MASTAKRVAPSMPDAVNAGGRAAIAGGVTWLTGGALTFEDKGRGPLTIGTKVRAGGEATTVGAGRLVGGTNVVFSFRSGPITLGCGSDSRRSATGRVSGFDTAARQSWPCRQPDRPTHSQLAHWVHFQNGCRMTRTHRIVAETRAASPRGVRAKAEVSGLSVRQAVPVHVILPITQSR